MRSDDPGRVYRRKGYGTIDRLNRCAAIWSTDGIYFGSNYGLAEHFSPLLLRLVLIINWASQYIVDGGSGL